MYFMRKLPKTKDDDTVLNVAKAKTNKHTEEQDKNGNRVLRNSNSRKP